MPKRPNAAALHGSNAAFRDGNSGKISRGDEELAESNERSAVSARSPRARTQSMAHLPKIYASKFSVSWCQLPSGATHPIPYAVKADPYHSPAMTANGNIKLRLMEQGKFHARNHGRNRRGDQRHRQRVKEIRGRRRVARETDILSPTDGKPLRETLRGYKSQDGEFIDLQGHWRRENGGVRGTQSWSKKVSSVARRVHFRQDARDLSPPRSNS